MIYGIGVVFFFFAVSGDKQPWADGVSADHKENIPYSNDGNQEEKKPLLDEKREGEESTPTSSEQQPQQQTQDEEESKK